MVFVSPKYAGASAALLNPAEYVIGATVVRRRSVVLPIEPNHATPSRTRSKVNEHAHADGGATTVAFTVTVAPESTFARSGVRLPSQTMALPVATSCQ